MFATLGKVLGNLFYWIGCGIAVLVLAQAIFMAASGNPLLPVLLGGVGVIVWLIGRGLKRILAGPSDGGTP